MKTQQELFASERVQRLLPIVAGLLASGHFTRGVDDDGEVPSLRVTNWGKNWQARHPCQYEMHVVTAASDVLDRLEEEADEWAEWQVEDENDKNEGVQAGDPKTIPTKILDKDPPIDYKRLCGPTATAATPGNHLVNSSLQARRPGGG